MISLTIQYNSKFPFDDVKVFEQLVYSVEKTSRKTLTIACLSNNSSKRDSIVSTGMARSVLHHGNGKDVTEGNKEED